MSKRLLSFLRRALFACALLPLCAKPDAVVEREFVFDEAPFPDCHAATIAEAPDGRLICAWFGGTYEKSPDTGIWMSQRKDGEWTVPLEFANGLLPSGKRYASWNPVLFTAADGAVWCAYRLGDSPRAWHGHYRRSYDSGETWDAQRDFPKGMTGAVRNPPVQLPNGRLVLPSSTEFHSSFGWRPHFELSDDGGETWRIVEPDANGFNAIQPAVFAHKDGSLQAVFRTRDGVLASSFSKDGGEHWSPLESPGVENPNAGIAALALDDGRFLLAHNAGKADRRTLVLSVSNDGRAWTQALVVREADDEVSYPSLIQTRDGLVHLVYTFNRARIAHDVIDPKRL